MKEIKTPQTYAEALRRLADEVEAKEQIQYQLEQKTEQLDESKEWYSIKRWAKEHNMNWRCINWRRMKHCLMDWATRSRRYLTPTMDR